MKEKFEGTILGLAIGDALGYPAEFRTRKQLLANFPPSGLTDMVSIDDPRFVGGPYIIGARQEAGTYSDDTQMTIAVAKGLLDAGLAASLDRQMEAIGRRFVEWSNSDENNRAPGSTCMTGCRNLELGVPWRQAGVAHSKGCGSAMRVAPIGLLYRDREHLLEVARASSILTHGHDAGIEGAAAAALAVGMALGDASPQEIYKAIAAECCPRSPDFKACWERLETYWDAELGVALSSDGIGEGWVAEEAVASALWVYARYENDVSGGLLAGANTDGDSDSIACIAGSILGARWGISALPDTWVKNVENSAYLFDLSKRMYRQVCQQHQPQAASR